MGLLYRTEIVAKAISGILNRPLENFDWFEIKAQAEDEAEILIYDYVGWPFNDAGDLIRSLRDMHGKNITVRINSPGGDVWDAMAIYNAFISHDAKVTTRGEAVVASAASIILLSGEEIQVYKNNMIMIHEPLALTMGNQHDHREIADLLAKINENMVDIYMTRAKTGKKELKNMLKDDTWMTAKEAKEKGFVDIIIDKKADAKAIAFDLSVFANIPDNLRQDLTIRDAEKALRDAGFSKNKAKALLSGRQSGDQWDADSFDEIDNLLTETIQIV